MLKSMLSYSRAKVLRAAPCTFERNVRAKHKKLLAADSRHEIGLANGLLKQGGGFAEDHVADRVAMSVIHFFEVIDIQHDAGKGHAVAIALVPELGKS